MRDKICQAQNQLEMRDQSAECDILKDYELEERKKRIK